MRNSQWRLWTGPGGSGFRDLVRLRQRLLLYSDLHVPHALLLCSRLVCARRPARPRHRPHVYGTPMCLARSRTPGAAGRARMVVSFRTMCRLYHMQRKRSVGAYRTYRDCAKVKPLAWRGTPLYTTCRVPSCNKVSHPRRTLRHALTARAMRKAGPWDNLQL